MKVGLFIDTWYPMVDGVIKVVDNYARRLTRYCDVVVFTTEAKGYDVEEDAAFPYQIVRCSALSMINLDYSLPAAMLDPSFGRILLDSQLDIVHIHSPFTVGLSGLLHAKHKGIPVVATLHSQYKQDLEKPLKAKPIVGMALSTIMSVFNACNECWAVNASIQELYQDEYGLTAPCKVRLNATDLQPVQDRAAAAALVNETYGIPADAVVFLFVGRIDFIKNIDFTVRSLAIAKAQGLKNFRMLFVGKGKDEERLAALVHEQGLDQEVVMCGMVSDRHMLENLYARAKLFLFPSMYDANSLVQIESASQSTPALFLRGARTASTVQEDVNGYISDPTEEQYARKILDILSHPEDYARVSEAAGKELFLDWDTVVHEVYYDYCDLIKNNLNLKKGFRLF